MAAWTKCTTVEPARCASEEDAVGVGFSIGEGLGGDEEVEEGLEGGFFRLEIEVLATTHLYFGGQSKAR